MMERIEIEKELKEALNERVKDAFEDAEIVFNEVPKNNQILQGFCVRTKETSIAPQIYIDRYVDSIFKGENTVENASDEIIDLYTDAVKESHQLDISSISPEGAKDCLRATIINAKNNQEMLKDCIHEIVEEYAIIPKYRVSENMAFTVKKENCGMLGLSENEVIEIAKKNLRKDGYNVKTMGETLCEMMDVPSEFRDELLANTPPIYVVTNREKTYGAVGIFAMKDLRKEVFDKIGEPYYCIGSSVHEVLCIGESFCDDPDALTSLIGEVNENEVAVEERLAERPVYVNEKLQVLTLDKLKDIKETPAKDIKVALAK